MKISVVMTTYNGEAYLEEQIESILAQTLKPVEFIVCDDCSTDQTCEILEKYHSKKLLKFWRNEKQLGVVANFKKAVSLANPAHFIALSDQDDRWLCDKLEKSAYLMQGINLIQKPSLVFTDLVLIDQDEKVLNNSFRNEHGQDKYQYRLESLVFGNFVNGCTMLMNPALTAFFKDVPDDIILNHDGWMALVAYTFGIAETIPESLVLYRKHQHNLSIDPNLKPRNRYRSSLKELINSFKGDQSFLHAQLMLISRFHAYYKEDLPASKRVIFEQFMRLKSKPYLIRKLAFKKMVSRYKL